MTPALLRAAGELLYGPRWQAELAREIGRARSLVARMATGENAVTPATWDAVMEALQIRQYEIGVFIDRHIESTSLVMKPRDKPKTKRDAD